VAGSIATGVTELSYPHAYRISYPEFLDHMNAIGIPAGVSGRFAASVGPRTPSGHGSR
jgi:3-phosphoshikimate 1-carboxyvinyltransferase